MSELTCKTCKHWHKKTTAGPALIGASEMGECLWEVKQAVIGVGPSGEVALSAPYYPVVPSSWRACAHHESLNDERLK